MTAKSTRSSILAGAAAVPVAALPVAAHDPTFAAIERFLRAKEEHDHDLTDDEAIQNAFFAAQDAVLRTEPTTRAGAAALIGLALAEQDSTGGCWTAEGYAIIVLERLQKAIPRLAA